MAMTLADWQAHRDAVEAAIRDLTTDNALSVTIGDRQFTRMSLPMLNRQLAKANKRINDLRAGRDTLFARTVRIVTDYDNLEAEDVLWG